MNIFNPTMTEVYVFLLVFIRVTAILMLLPVFGNTSIPVQLKVGLSILMSMLLAPVAMAGFTVDLPENFWRFSQELLLELVIGLLIGYISAFLFVALQFAGRLIDIQMGFGMVQTIDPMSNAASTAMGQLQVLIFTMVFLLSNTHYLLLIAMKKSFEIIPLLSVAPPKGEVALILTSLCSGVLVSGLKLAAPVFVTLVLTTLALGLVARTVPQMNVFFVGMPLKIGVGIATMVIVLPILGRLFLELTDQLMINLWKVLYLLA